MRNTKQKDFVLNNLKNRFDHPTAYQIIESAKNENINIGTTSVYRILNDLIGYGMACKIVTKDNVAHFDYLKNDHIHLVCNKCSKIIDVPNEEIFKANINLHGFKLITQDITLYGECENCKDRINNKYKNK